MCVKGREGGLLMKGHSSPGRGIPDRWKEVAPFSGRMPHIATSGDIFSEDSGVQLLNYQQGSVHHFAGAVPIPPSSKQPTNHRTDLCAISFLPANFFLSASAAPYPRQAWFASAKSLCPLSKQSPFPRRWRQQGTGVCGCPRRGNGPSQPATPTALLGCGFDLCLLG